MRLGIPAMALVVASVAACSARPLSSPMAEVIEAAMIDGNHVYTFDPAGLSTSIGSNSSSYGITRSNDDLVAGADAYHFDALGRVVTIDQTRIAYGPDGQIDHATHDGHVVSYVYDEEGSRILKSVDGSSITAYVPDDGARVTASELDEPVVMGGRLIGVLRNGAFTFTATDMRGTVQADVDGTPRPASPFGARVAQPDVAQVIDYAGKGFDPDLGAERMGVRDYDARIARFLQPDPLFLASPEKCVESPVECNLYGYAKNRPADFVDPTGKASDDANMSFNTGTFTAPQDGPMCVSPDAAPTSYRDAIGAENYYRLRQQDFDNRHQMSGGLITNYYLNYGDKYLHMFVRERANLSPQGRVWDDHALVNLQLAIESKRDADPSAFARMEESGALRDFAFASHVGAYESAGVLDLGVIDGLKIMFTPQLKDSFGSWSGLKQLAHVGYDYVGATIGHAMADPAPGILGAVERAKRSASP